MKFRFYYEKILIFTVCIFKTTIRMFKVNDLLEFRLYIIYRINNMGKFLYIYMYSLSL